MELAYYSDYAVRLVNTEEPARGKDALTSVEAVRDLFGTNQEAARRAAEADVTRFRSVRARLRAVFEAADGGDETLSVNLLNSLLLEFPVSPQISGHNFRDDNGRPLWHMHLADHPSNATAGYAAIAAMGLAFHLTEYGVDRLGLCEAAPCRNAYLDTSTNRSRRYCSDRCATGPTWPPTGPGSAWRPTGRGARAWPPRAPSGRARAANADRPSAAGTGNAPCPAPVPRARRRSPCCPHRRTRCPPAPTTPVPALRRPLHDQQVLLERMPQHDDVPWPDPGAVLHHEQIPVQQRRHHGRPGHLGRPEGQCGPPALGLLRQLRHPRHLPGPILHQSESDPGLLS